MPNSLLILGNKRFSEPESSLQKLARSGLIAVGPSRIITSYSIGWEDIVLKEAKKLGIPYMGVLPFPSNNPEFKTLSQGASSNLVFNRNKKDYLNSPNSYLKWLNSYVNEVMLYLDPAITEEVIVKKISQCLKGKIIRNFYRK
jgi:hypothetical protein